MNLWSWWWAPVLFGFFVVFPAIMIGVEDCELEARMRCEVAKRECVAVCTARKSTALGAVTWGCLCRDGTLFRWPSESPCR